MRRHKNELHILLSPEHPQEPAASHSRLGRRRLELALALDESDLNLEARKKALHAECGPVDGRASERIADALVAIANKHAR